MVWLKTPVLVATNTAGKDPLEIPGFGLRVITTFVTPPPPPPPKMM